MEIDRFVMPISIALILRLISQAAFSFMRIRDQELRHTEVYKRGHEGRKISAAAAEPLLQVLCAQQQRGPRSVQSSSIKQMHARSTAAGGVALPR